MLHSDAITIIKHGGDVVKLIVRRIIEQSFIACEYYSSESPYWWRTLTRYYLLCMVILAYIVLKMPPSVR